MAVVHAAKKMTELDTRKRDSDEVWTFAEVLLLRVEVGHFVASLF